MSFKPVEGVTFFSGDESEKSVCIMGSIHGNERIGAAVLDELKPILAFSKINRNIYLILGNPRAYSRDVRYVDMDMNRLFGVENMNLGDEKVMNEYASEKYSKMKYEESRAIEIARVLAECSYLLDIHSTIKPSIPFVYSEADDDHMALASLMGTKFAVSPDAHFRPLDLVSSADNYVDRAGGTGITYESGWHKDELAVDETLFRAKLFLQKTGACNFGLHEPENTTEVQQLLIYDHVVPQTTSFIFARDFSNFDTVATGEIIGSDGGREISAQRDCSIIFPKKVIQQGRAACYLAYAH